MSKVESIKKSKPNAKDLENIRILGKNIEPELGAVTEGFVQWIAKEASYPDALKTPEVQVQIKAHQMMQWKLFFAADINDQFVQFNRAIGESNAQMDLPISMYFASLTLTSELFKTAFIRLGLDQFELLHSFNKLLLFGSALAIDAYNDLVQNRLQQQSEALMEISTPVAQLWDGILLLPLVGVIDSKRAQEAMTTMLNKISETQAKAFILDISGVGVVDTAVANHLIKMTKAAKLMGCLCTISGLSPAVAQTIVELGVQIDEVNTTATMKDALKNAFSLVGTNITRTKHE